MKKITDLTDVELKEIYDKFFFDTETDKEFYLIRDDYGGIQMGQDDNTGMEFKMTNGGSMYLYCCDNGEIYDSPIISDAIQFLQQKKVFPYFIESNNE